MTFYELIEKVDALYPNPFSLDEKIAFAGELSDYLHLRYFRLVKFEEVVFGAGFKMPVHYTADRVCGIYFNGRKYKFSHFLNMISRGEIPYGSKFKIEYIYCPPVSGNESLPVSSAFDGLFIYYVLAKIYLHLDDAASYNNYMQMYNSLLNDYVESLNDRSDENITCFKNIW